MSENFLGVGRRLIKILNGIFYILFLMTIFLSKNSTARNVEATFTYCSTSGVQAWVCPYNFATPGEVFLKYQEWLPAGSSGFSKAVRYFPNLADGTANRLATFHAVESANFINGAWQVGGQFNLIFRLPHCAQSNYTNMVYLHQAGRPENEYDVICTGSSTVIPDPGCEKCQPSAGNPIYISTGTKFQKEIDYVGAGSNELEFSRIYRSDRKGWSHNYQTYGVDFSVIAATTIVPCYADLQQDSNWPSCFRYWTRGTKNDFMIQRSGKRIVDFGTDTDLLPAMDISDRVLSSFASGGNVLSVYNASDESTERFDKTGRLQSVTSRNGRVKKFFYSDETTPISIASSAGLLISVADDFGHSLKFTYDSSNRMTTMTDPADGVTRYGYDERSSVVLQGKFPANNLTSVTLPDGNKRLYWYNEQDKTSSANLPFALTGITDELGVRFATFTYDAAGRAISSEHAGGVEKFNVAFPSLWSKSTVTDPLGTLRTYTFQTILGSSKTTGVSQPGPGGVGTVSTSILYDSQANVTRSTDFNGAITTFSYDLKRNLETSRVEAYDTPLARTTSTEWHTTFRLPMKIAEPQRLTTFTYDSSGNVVTRTMHATSDLTGVLGTKAATVGIPRTVNFAYNAVGQLLTETGPRTDVANTTTYTYDSNGNLATVINAAKQETIFQNYDANGRPGRVVAANGVTTDLTYWPRGWLKQHSISAGGISEITSYDYDGAGQLKTVSLPDHSTLNYDYDAAHRLISVTDSVGNKVTYAYDLASNRVLDQVTDPAHLLTTKITRVYDALNLLNQQTGGVQ